MTQEQRLSSPLLFPGLWTGGEWTQKPGTGLECQACCMTASSVGWLFLLLYGQHGLIACPRAAAAACIACIATKLGFLTFKGRVSRRNIFETLRKIKLVQYFLLL